MTGAQGQSAYATGKNVLVDAGVAQVFEAYNNRAVELAIQARERAGPSADHVVVAGGISNWSFSGDRPSHETLHKNTAEQAKIMGDVGAELVSLEMMVDLARMTATLDAVSSVDPPIWVGLTIGPEEGHDVSSLSSDIELREGGLLSEAVEGAKGYGRVDAFCLMHSDVRLTERGVATIRGRCHGTLRAVSLSTMCGSPQPMNVGFSNPPRPSIVSVRVAIERRTRVRR